MDSRKLILAISAALGCIVFVYVKAGPTAALLVALIDIGILTLVSIHEANIEGQSNGNGDLGLGDVDGNWDFD